MHSLCSAPLFDPSSVHWSAATISTAGSIPFFFEWSWCQKFASGSIDFECWSSIWWLLKYTHWIKSSSILREEKKVLVHLLADLFTSDRMHMKITFSNISAHSNYIGYRMNAKHNASDINYKSLRQTIDLFVSSMCLNNEREKKTVSSIPRWRRCNAGCLSICHIKSKLNTAVRRSY